MKELTNLIADLKNKFPDKLPTDRTITNSDLAFLQGQQFIISHVEQYQKALLSKKKESRR